MSFLRKFTKLALGTAALIALVSVATGTALAQCSACVNSVTLPSGMVTFVPGTTAVPDPLLNTSAPTDPAGSGHGYFTYTLANVPVGTSLANDSYSAWCASWFFSPLQTDANSGGQVYSSYAPDFPAGAQPLVTGNTFNMVNYILNNKTGTVQDVQDAIWLIMTGYTDNPASPIGVALAAAAQNNPNYIPNALGVMAVLYTLGPAAIPSLDIASTTGTFQTVMLELPVPMVGSTNSCASCVSGIQLPANVQHSTAAKCYSPSTTAPASTGSATITLTGVPSGMNVGNKQYKVWYGGWWTSNVVSGLSGFPIYSTYASNYPAGLKPRVTTNTMNMVNFILNNKQGSVADVQNAIYKIMVGSAPGTLSAASLAMVNLALQHSAYCPPANGSIAVVIAASSNIGASSTLADSQNMPLILEITCSAPPPTGTPSLSLKKTADKTRVNPFVKVTYTYVVTNNGTVPLANVVVVDDNATPGDTKDDFTVGTVASLAPGASATLTASVYPPVKEAAQQDSNDWGGFGNWGSHEWERDDDNKFDGGTVICKELPNGNLHITYKQDKGTSDNTYGRGSSSDWGLMGHSFQSYVNSTDGAQLQILDKSGNVMLDFVADYISPSSKYRSGYGSLGVKGGDGKVYKGNVAHILRCDSSLSKNLNRQTRYFKATSDSPKAADWDEEQSYTIVIDKAACGNGGFGGVKLPKVKNDRSKHYGDESHVTHPTSSVATNTATASAIFDGTTVKATAKASVTIDASSSGWSQCSKY